MEFIIIIIFFFLARLKYVKNINIFEMNLIKKISGITY